MHRCVHSAIVPSSSVRPAETSIQALGVKRTLGFMRACSELARHRELLARPASHSDDSSDEHDRLDASHRKVNTWLVCQPFLHQGAYAVYLRSALQCFDAVGWVAGRASGL